MKTYGEWRHSSTILDLGTIWRRVFSFTLPLLYALRKSPQYPLGEPQNRSGRYEEKNNVLRGIEPSCPARSPSLHRLSYPNFCWYIRTHCNIQEGSKAVSSIKVSQLKSCKHFSSSSSVIGLYVPPISSSNLTTVLKHVL
jgi:hypothetical protein